MMSANAKRHVWQRLISFPFQSCNPIVMRPRFATPVQVLGPYLNLAGVAVKHVDFSFLRKKQLAGSNPPIRTEMGSTHHEAKLFEPENRSPCVVRGVSPL